MVLGIALITDLLDTLGIGSFATTTTLFKATKMIDDDSHLPGTMNAVHVIPVLIQSLCLILVVNVDPLTQLPLPLSVLSLEQNSLKTGTHQPSKLY